MTLYIIKQSRDWIISSCVDPVPFKTFVSLRSTSRLRENNKVDPLRPGALDSLGINTEPSPFTWDGPTPTNVCNRFRRCEILLSAPTNMI